MIGIAKKVPYKDFITKKTINGKFYCSGSIFFHNTWGGRPVRDYEKIVDIQVPEHAAKYMACISLTMLNAYGGDFDEDDAVFADIYEIDGRKKNVANGYGGCWAKHFGSKGHNFNQNISSYVGVIQNIIKFRLYVYGDNYAGASFFVMEL